MEAAIVAAQRGHEVVLCEKGHTLGGQVNLCACSIRRGEMALSMRWATTRRWVGSSRRLDTPGATAYHAANMRPEGRAEG